MKILGKTENRYSGVPPIINAMEEYGLLEMTIPDKPKSKFQKYYTFR